MDKKVNQQPGNLTHKFPINTKMLWKDSNEEAYVKYADDSWASLQHDVLLPFDKRYGFRWDDKMVYDYYNDIMIFKYDNVPNNS